MLRSIRLAAIMLMYHLTKLLLLAESQCQVDENDRAQVRFSCL